MLIEGLVFPANNSRRERAFPRSAIAYRNAAIAYRNAARAPRRGDRHREYKSIPRSLLPPPLSRQHARYDAARAFTAAVCDIEPRRTESGEAPPNDRDGGGRPMLRT